MGGSNSTTISSTAVNNFLNQQTNSISNSISQNVNASSQSMQVVTLAGAEFTDCNVAILQASNSQVNAKGTLSVSNTADLSSKLQAAADAKMTQMAQQSNSGMFASGTNNSNSSTSTVNDVKNIINTTITSKTVQDIIANASSSQIISAGGFKAKCNPKYTRPGPCGPEGTKGCNFVFDQNIRISATASGIADAVTKAIQESSTVGKFVTDTAQTSDQSNTGLQLPDFSGMIAGLGAAGALVCICCSCMCFLLFALILMPKH